MTKVEAAKVLVKFGAELGMDIEKSLADGHLDAADAVRFFPILTSIGDVVAAAKDASFKMADYTADELKQINDELCADLNLDNKALEAVIEKSFLVVESILELVTLSKSLKKVAAPAAPAV